MPARFWRTITRGIGTRGTGNDLRRRPEIDGLRALAVVLVILYHTGLACPGGYVGVDVFFVISGYLITSLILAEIAHGEFSIIGFWERRARRILPALACTVAVCMGMGWAILMPPDFDALGQSMVYQSLLSSNLFFSRSTNYLSAHDAHPLLHTWSLAVEEQFYVFFPILLTVLRPFRKTVLLASLGAIALGSLCLSIIGTEAHPVAAFYLLPFRAWELVLGALLAAAPDVWPRRTSAREGLGWIGLGLILFAAMAYDSSTRFPGARAVVPCIGTTLVIASNSRCSTHLGRLLSTRPIVFIGWVSYSLYLWHWPALVFTRYLRTGALSVSTALLVVVGSLLLATISWMMVERPFRDRVVLVCRWKLFTFAGLVSVSLLAGGTLIHFKAGLPSRLRPEALRYLEGRDDKDFRIELAYESAAAGLLPEIGRLDAGADVELLVWGDSHAMALLHVLDVVCREAGIRALAATHSATAPLLSFRSVSPYSLEERSIPYNQAILDVVRDRHIKKVLLAADWNTYLRGGEASFVGALRGTIEALRSAGATVLLVKDVPRQPFEVPKALAIAAQRGQQPPLLGLPGRDYQAQGASADRVFGQLAGPGVTVVDPAPILMDEDGTCRIEADGYALYFDHHHLSTHGAMLLKPLFKAAMAGGLPGQRVPL